MMNTTPIRTSGPADNPAIERLYREVFPGEDLVPLVRDLLGDPAGVLSLVAVLDDAIVAHVGFTACAVEGSDARVDLLGPLAVAPAHQRRGLGRALVREGMERLAHGRCVRVCVLGDPAYYARLGFAAETAIAPPYALPAEWREAWQSLALRPGAPRLSGRLVVPQPWRRPSLWQP